MICALDTQTLIFALDPKSADRDLRRRAKLLIDRLESTKTTVIIPTVVVAEWLVGIDAADHGRFLAELQKRFLTPPLDLRASALAATLWQRHRALPRANQVKRSILKADVLIIATAKAAGATRLYSHDADCRAVAKLVMEAFDLPTHSEKLFEG